MCGKLSLAIGMQLQKCQLTGSSDKAQLSWLGQGAKITTSQKASEVRTEPILMKASPSNTCEAILQHVISKLVPCRKAVPIIAE